MNIPFPRFYCCLCSLVLVLTLSVCLCMGNLIMCALCKIFNVHNSESITCLCNCLLFRFTSFGRSDWVKKAEIYKQIDRTWALILTLRSVIYGVTVFAILCCMPMFLFCVLLYCAVQHSVRNKLHISSISQIHLYVIFVLLPARRYASAVFAIATCPSVRLSVCHTPVLCLAERKQDREMYTIW